MRMWLEQADLDELNVKLPSHGAASVSMTCRYCQSPVSGRFCPSCGRSNANVGGAAGPWFWVGGGLILAFVFALGVVVGRGGRPAGAGVGAEPAPVQAPDISNMTPRERFDRLYDRV